MEEDKEESKSAPSGQALRYSALKALGTIDRGERRTWYEIAPGWSRTGAPLGRRPLSAMLSRSANTGGDITYMCASG